MGDEALNSPAEQQVLRYAADLARLYAQASADRERLHEVEAGLVRLAAVSLELVRSLSLADAGQRLARAAVDALGLPAAAVYLQSKDRYTLLAKEPESAAFPYMPPVRKEDLASLGGEADELESPPWTTLSGGQRVAIVPLRGRRHGIGFLAGLGALPHLHGPTEGAQASLLMLLAGHAGIVLENHLLEERRSEARATRALRPPTRPRGVASDELLGSSPAMDDVLHLVGRLAKVDSRVLLTGETGTGKTLVARLIHGQGPRAAAPFVTLNCAAIPNALVESELFGHEAGAFTGALKLHRGRVEQAKGGTLFLDEVGELPLDVQSKLLNFLEDGRYTRVGGETELLADVRLISATNRDLQAAVEEKAFREDLLYRLNVFTVDMPPLRRRGADVLLLARALAGEVAARYGLPEPTFEPEVESRLRGYGWPGNVRELRNVMEKAVILADGGPIPPELLPAPSAAQRDASSSPTPASDGPRTVGPAAAALDASQSFADAKARLIEDWEVAYITALLRSTSGNIARAARIAKIDKKNLHRKLKKYGIDAATLRAT